MRKLIRAVALPVMVAVFGVFDDQPVKAAEPVVAGRLIIPWT